MNAPWADQKWLAPRAVECRNVRGERDDGSGKSVKRGETERGRVQHFAGFGAPRSRGKNGLANFRRITHGAEHDFCLRVIGNDVRRTASGDSSNIKSARPEQRIFRQRDYANGSQNIE